MDAGFQNVYEDEARSRAYANLEFPGTYYLAYRDLPTIIRTHTIGSRALDFGCGTGRSTRFLRALGFETMGLDISESMLAHARSIDPTGDYCRVADGDLRGLAPQSFNLILAVFTFDNIPTHERKVSLFRDLGSLLAKGGSIVTVVSSPDIYVHEWASFTTKDFPENRTARCGDRVRIVMLDVADRRPVEDILWTESGYRTVHDEAELRTIETYRPLGNSAEPYPWVNETRIGPWVIYVLRR